MCNRLVTPARCSASLQHHSDQTGLIVHTYAGRVDLPSTYRSAVGARRGCTLLIMSSPVRSICTKIGFDVSADYSEHHGHQQHSPRDCQVPRKTSLLSKALSNPSVTASRTCNLYDMLSDTDDEEGCSDEEHTGSVRSSSSVSSPIPIQCSHSRVAAGFAIARWHLRQQQQRHNRAEAMHHGMPAQAVNLTNY